MTQKRGRRSQGKVRGEEGHRKKEHEGRTRKEVRKVTEKRKRKKGQGKMFGRTQKRGKIRQG
jgi:hypothetical protein